MSRSNNTDKPKDLYPHSISASSVSERFYEAVRAAARKNNLTMQTFARWCVEVALGRNPVKPAPEVSGTYSLGTSVDKATNMALEAALKGKGPVNDDGQPTDYPKAQWLREVLAKAADYTFGPDDIAGSPGEAAKKRAETNRMRDTFMSQLWETNPDIVRATAKAQGKTLRELGIYDPQEEDAEGQEAATDGEAAEPATV